MATLRCAACNGPTSDSQVGTAPIGNTTDALSCTIQRAPLSPVQRGANRSHVGGTTWRTTCNRHLRTKRQHEAQVTVSREVRGTRTQSASAACSNTCARPPAAPQAALHASRHLSGCSRARSQSLCAFIQWSSPPRVQVQNAIEAPAELAHLSGLGSRASPPLNANVKCPLGNACGRGEFCRSLHITELEVREACDTTHGVPTCMHAFAFACGVGPCLARALACVRAPAMRAAAQRSCVRRSGLTRRHTGASARGVLRRMSTLEYPRRASCERASCECNAWAVSVRSKLPHGNRWTRRS